MTTYFMIQKLFGLAMVLLGIISIPVLEGDATAAVFMVPLGIATIFAKDKVVDLGSFGSYNEEDE